MQLISKKTLLAMIPLSEKAIYNMEQRGDFPRRIALTSRNVAWDLDEIAAWIEHRKTTGAKAARPGPTDRPLDRPEKRSKATNPPSPTKGHHGHHSADPHLA